MSDPLPERARKHAFERFKAEVNAAQKTALEQATPVVVPKERLPSPVGRYNELARRLAGGESVADAAGAMRVDVKGCELVADQPWFKDLMLRQKEKQP